MWRGKLWTCGPAISQLIYFSNFKLDGRFEYENSVYHDSHVAGLQDIFVDNVDEYPATSQLILFL